MRFIITLITSLILLLPASGQGEWRIVEVEIDDVFIGIAKDWRPIDGLADVQFIDRDIGFFIGGCYGWWHAQYGVLYKTEDGGRSWNRIYEDDVAFSNSHFVNKSKGFIMGKWYGNWLTTSDGGYSWSEDTNVDQASDVFFLNDSIGWAVGDGQQAKNYKTIDGGENWSEEYGLGGKFNSMYFTDEQSGWAVGEAGLISKYTLNGWLRLTQFINIPLNEVFFVDRDNGWISGGYNNQDGFSQIFLRTVDGGENWDNISAENYLINDFYFVDRRDGWAVGEDKNGRGVILETFSSGHDWDVVVDSLPARLNALDFTDGIGWAVGDNYWAVVDFDNVTVINNSLILKYEPTATGIEDNKITSGNESLFQNYPNPFQSSTIISYQIPAINHVELSIYDISGRKVATLVNERQQPDRYKMEWNAEGMESGIYFCELRTGQRKQVMKMSIVK